MTSDLVLARAARELDTFCAWHIPARARHQIRLESMWRGRVATLVERRPPWDGRGTEWTSRPIARFRHDPALGKWRVYWQRANGRWLEVEELRSTAFAAALRGVADDRSGVFWG